MKEKRWCWSWQDWCYWSQVLMDPVVDLGWMLVLDIVRGDTCTCMSEWEGFDVSFLLRPSSAQGNGRDIIFMTDE